MPDSVRNDKKLRGRMTPSLLIRRVFHDFERRYLSEEAQGLAYRYLMTEEVPIEITERAVLEAVSLGQLKNSAVDGLLFDALVDALLEDRSFEMPGGSAEKVYPSSCWIC